MKKTLFVLFVLAGILTACERNEKDLSIEYTKIQLGKYVMTEKFNVPVQEGYETVVTYGEDTLYVGNLETSIDVSKIDDMTTRAADDIRWQFIPINTSKYTGGGKYSYKTSRSGLLLFEDIPTGDCDYNDFVCWIKEEVTIGSSNGNDVINSLSLANFQIKPLAMGNILPLAFGFEVRDLRNGKIFYNIIFSNDIRKDYFKGVDGFINTLPESEGGVTLKWNEGAISPYLGNARWTNPGFRNNEFCISWFIIANGIRHYTADTSLKLAELGFPADELVTKNHVPYGLFLPNKTEKNFKWPKETVALAKAYLEFNAWLEGKNNNPFSQPQQNLLYNPYY